MRAIPAVCATEVMGNRDPGSPDHIRRRADRKRFAWAYSQMDDKIAGSVLPHVPSMFLPDVHESVSEYASRIMDYDRDALHEDMVRMDMLDETTGVQEARVLVAKTSAFVQLAAQLDQQWRSIKATETIGRVHTAKERADMKKEMDDGIEHVTKLYKRRDVIDGVKAELLEQQEEALIKGTLNNIQVKQNKDRLALYDQQVRDIDRKLGVLNDKSHSKDAKIFIPSNLDTGRKGKSFITNMDTFVDENRGRIPIARHILKRIGHDMHPDFGLFWGHPECGSTEANATGLQCIPCESNAYADLEEHLIPRYKKEIKWICDVMRQSFQNANQLEVYERVFQNFQCGILGDETAICEMDNGAMAYWGIVSMTRPVDEEHRNKVEEHLNNSFCLLYKNDMAWDVCIKETRPWIVEAKLLGLRIKWMYTGRRWLNALSSNIKVYSAATVFRSGGEDPQDCILYFEKLLGVLEKETMADVGARKEKKMAFSALHQEAEQEQHALSDFIVDGVVQGQQDQHDLQDDTAFALEQQRRIPCKFGSRCRNPRSCRFYHPEREHNGEQINPRRGGYGKATLPIANDWKIQGRDRMRSNMRKCFSKGCERIPFKGKALCLKCHRKSISQKAVTGKDGDRRAYIANDVTVDTQLVEAAEAFFASNENVHDEDEWDQVRHEALQASEANNELMTMDREQLVQMYHGAMEQAMIATAEKRSSADAMLGQDADGKRFKSSQPDAQEVLRKVTERMATRAWEQPQ